MGAFLNCATAACVFILLRPCAPANQPFQGLCRLYNSTSTPFPPCLTSTHKVEMANTESDIAIATDKKVVESDQMIDVDKKEFSEQEKVVAPETQPKPKRLWLERLILCVALFFPLFLATLDTSIHPK